MSNASIIRWYPHSKKQNTLSTNLRFTVKDNYSVRHYPVSAGFSPPIIPSASQTAPIIEKLQNVGHQLIAACNLDPGAIGASGINPYWGDMNSALSPASYSVFGSSGGSAVSIREDIADYSLVTDIAGSARLPALACGLYGIKLRSSTQRIVEGVLLHHSLIDTLGFITNKLSIASTITSLLIPEKTPSIEYVLHHHENSQQEKHSELFQEIQACHKQFVAFAIHHSSWLPSQTGSREIQALKKFGEKLELSHIEQKREELLTQALALFTPHFLLATEISLSQLQKSPGYFREIHPILVAANLFDWPALVAPIDSTKSVHLTGPVEMSDLLSELEANDLQLNE